MSIRITSDHSPFGLCIGLTAINGGGLMFRVTGRVTRVDTLRGSKAQPDGSSRDWAMTVVKVLVLDSDVVDVMWPDRLADEPVKGDLVDLLVEVRPRNASRISATVVDLWPEG